MEYEYRKLSDERAAEIDVKGFKDVLGKKISINAMESVTNEKESVVFRQTWFSHEENEPDKYFFAYKGYYFSVEIFRDIKSERKEESKDYYYVYNISKIYTKAMEGEDYQLKEVLVVLKDVIAKWNKFTLGRTNPRDKFFVEVRYKGERV